jgi:hypothetical protein
VQKILTPTVDEQVCEGLRKAYREMAADRAREAEALDWAEETCGDIADEETCPFA